MYVCVRCVRACMCVRMYMRAHVVVSFYIECCVRILREVITQYLGRNKNK